jgi:hypothetical protein
MGIDALALCPKASVFEGFINLPVNNRGNTLYYLE